jgi:iron(III) transport system substrate-binding protein
VKNSFIKYSAVTSLLCSSLFISPFALAQSRTGDPATSEIALSQARNRQQILVDNAKKEGALTIYYSSGDMKEVLEAFTKKYGIKVKSWKSNGENVLRRVVTESQARSNKSELDIVQNNGPEMEALHRENLLQPVNSPLHADLWPQAIPAHKAWVGTNIDVYVQAYNTNLIKKEELPKTYDDLLDPKWEGRLGIEADDHVWFATVLKGLGPEKGARLFKTISDTNGLSIRKGHAMLTNITASGEVPLSLSNYNYRVEQMKQKGAPIDYFILPPAVAGFKGIGLLKSATHPHAALLLYDFMLIEGQEIMLKRFTVPANKKFDSFWNKVPLAFIDPAESLDMNDKWTRIFEENVTKRAK